jgi:hypothetical protein
MMQRYNIWETEKVSTPEGWLSLGLPQLAGHFTQVGSTQPSINVMDNLKTDMTRSNGQVRTKIHVDHLKPRLANQLWMLLWLLA